MYKILAIATPATPPPQQAIGTGNWVKDPTPSVAGDLSTGAFFRVLPNGDITQLADGFAAEIMSSVMKAIGSSRK